MNTAEQSKIFTFCPAHQKGSFGEHEDNYYLTSKGVNNLYRNKLCYILPFVTYTVLYVQYLDNQCPDSHKAVYYSCHHLIARKLS